AVHARDLDVASERDRADPVLDAAADALDHGRREADVELPRPHADGLGREEVARLVDEDQEREAEDRRAEAHATGTRPRARRSASTRPPRSRAGEPSTRSRTSPTAAATSRKPIRPSRNAWTATSFAAL